MGERKLQAVRGLACAHCGISFAGKAGRKYCSPNCYHSDRKSIREAQRGDGGIWCPRCQTVKPPSDFYTGKRRDGWCKACRCADETRRRADPALVAQFREKYETDPTFRARELLRAVRKRCRRDGIEFDLDIPWLAARIERGVCEVTSLSFDLSIEGRKCNIFTPSIDRIEAGGGYTKANCRVVVFGLNVALREWGLDAFMPIAHALVDSAQTRNAA